MKKDMISKIFRKLPVLETQRLTLRRMKPEDCGDMFEYACREDVTEYLSWYPHPDKAYTKQYLELVRSRYASGEFFDWALVLKSEGKMVGTCGFTRFDESNNGAEVGYVINPSYRGMGLAPEALREVMLFGFMKLNLHRIEAKYMDGNEPSRRVMEKCGMQYEGCARSSMYIKGIYRSVHTCAIISDEFIRRYMK